MKRLLLIATLIGGAMTFMVGAPAHAACPTCSLQAVAEGIPIEPQNLQLELSLTLASVRSDGEVGSSPAATNHVDFQADYATSTTGDFTVTGYVTTDIIVNEYGYEQGDLVGYGTLTRTGPAITLDMSNGAGNTLSGNLILTGTDLSASTSHVAGIVSVGT